MSGSPFLGSWPVVSVAAAMSAVGPSSLRIPCWRARRRPTERRPQMGGGAPAAHQGPGQHPQRKFVSRDATLGPRSRPVLSFGGTSKPITDTNRKSASFVSLFARPVGRCGRRNPVLASTIPAQVSLLVQPGCVDGSTGSCTSSEPGCTRADKTCEGLYWGPRECVQYAPV